jgi:hypothetical protein
MCKILANMTQVSDVAPGPLVRRVMPLEGFYSFPDIFFSLLTDIHLIFGTLLCHIKIQIKFEFGSDPLILHACL